MKRFAMLVMLVLLAGSAFGETVVVAVSKAELRSQPSVGGAKVVKTLTLNTKLNVQKAEGRYLQVKDPQGTVGWIHNTLVSQGAAPASAPAAVSNPDTVSALKDGGNVRQGPGTSNPVVFTTKAGETFKVTGQSGNWLQISGENGRNGWISKSLTSAK